jgi:hypothetical protein
MMHMHGAEFSTAMQGRNGLAGVEQAERIKRMLHRVKLRQFVAFELRAHLIDLFDTDAVFARDRATGFHAELQDLAAEFFGAFQFAWLVGVIQDQRMQIAIAGMKYIGDPKFVLVGPGFDLL